MLKNITKVTVPLKYNGKIVKVAPGKAIDVRDFDIANKDVKNVEKGLIIKYPKTFESVKSAGDSDTEKDRENDKKVEALELKLKEAQDEVVKLREANKDLAENVETSSGELQKETERANSLKTEADAATVKAKDLEEEVEKLRLQIAQGKNK